MNKGNLVYAPAAVTTNRYRILYGGAGSGKSVFVAQDELQRAWKQGRRILVCRKVARTLRHSCFQLFKDLIKAANISHACRINLSDMTIDFPGSGGQIIHAGLDDVEKVKSIAGIHRIWIEESTELLEADRVQLDLRLRGPGAEQITETFNPIASALEIKDYYGIEVDGEKVYSTRDNVYVQRTTFKDNPWAGEEYAGVLASIPDENMRAIYERGEFVDGDEPDQLISLSDIKAAYEVEAVEGVNYLGVDVARFGDDKTVLCWIAGNDVCRIDSYASTSIPRTAELVQAALTSPDMPIDADNCGVDTVGLGAGAFDILKESGFACHEIVSGASPLELAGEYYTPLSWKFRNQRGQLYWRLREDLKARNLRFSFTDRETRKRVRNDLIALRYRIMSDKVIEIESKEHIKKRIGRSTDEGDAIAYANYVRYMPRVSWLMYGG